VLCLLKRTISQDFPLVLLLDNQIFMTKRSDIQLLGKVMTIRGVIDTADTNLDTLEIKGFDCLY
jgi:hypothetical protein